MVSTRGIDKAVTHAGSPPMRPAIGVLVALLAALAGGAGCSAVSNPPPDPAPAAPEPILAAGALLPSPRLLVGRIIAVDAPQRFAFVALAMDAPAVALATGTELIARTPDLQRTGTIEVSAYLRGRTLGTKIVAGQPSPGDEVVWQAP
jgi:hypothetical protein